MAVREIVGYPDPRLSAMAQPVETIDESLDGLIADVLDTMVSLRAAGLAAPHIGALKRVVAVRLDVIETVRIFINPKIVWFSEEMATHVEGSVSLPGLTAEVTRPSRVRVRFCDRAGFELEVEADGFFSACLQHEIDHLDGVFWLTRLSRLKRERLLTKVAKSKRDRLG